MNNEIKNYGVDIEKEKRDAEDTDWFEGERTHLGATIPKSKWEEVTGLVSASFAWANPIKGIYQKVNGRINHCWCFFQEKFKEFFPVGQLQNLGGEKYYCVTGGFNNEIEKQLNYANAKKLLSVGLLDFFHEYKFFDSDGKIRLSNRVPAKGSGTTRNGNSLKAVIQWIHDYGIFPQSILPEDVPMTFEEYYNGFELTDKILSVGIESKKYLNINYVKVRGSKKYPKYSDGFKWKIFDNYVDPYDGDFVKQLAPDYILLSYGYKLIINETGFEQPKPIEDNDMALQTLQAPPDTRIFIKSNTEPKTLIWIDDPDGTSWKDYKDMFLKHGLITQEPEKIQEAVLPNYKIEPFKVHGSYYNNEPPVPMGWWQKFKNILKIK